jgi:hypothetical protein
MAFARRYPNHICPRAKLRGHRQFKERRVINWPFKELILTSRAIESAKVIELTRRLFPSAITSKPRLSAIDLTGFLGPIQFGVAPVNKPFDCFLLNASGVSYFKLECGRTVL